MNESMPSSSQPPQAARNPRIWLVVSGVLPVGVAVELERVGDKITAYTDMSLGRSANASTAPIRHVKVIEISLACW